MAADCSGFPTGIYLVVIPLEKHILWRQLALDYVTEVETANEQKHLFQEVVISQDSYQCHAL